MNLLLEKVKEISLKIKQNGAKAYLVGGAVRDMIASEKIKDADIEVFGLEEDELEKLLSKNFKINTVGKSFGVFKVKGFDIDISLPRFEEKTGLGHKNFNIKTNANIEISEAAKRRDFTINSIYYDILEDKIIDPFGGQNDLKNKILKMTGPQFAEDPLRVLRAMQFIARFDLDVDEQTLQVCKTIKMEDLPKERIFEEFKKLILKGKNIKKGLEFLKNSTWVRYFPELANLIDCPQDKRWHPEGDVWTHTLLSMNAFSKLDIENEQDKLVVGLASLCHDMGKPETTTIEEDGKIHSYKHEIVGVNIARDFLNRLTNQKDLFDDILPLIKAHMLISQLFKSNAKDASIRRLAVQVGRIDRLVWLDLADKNGRLEPFEPTSEHTNWIIKKAQELKIKDSIPLPIVQGRDLINLGKTPSPKFGKILKICYEAQLDGVFNNKNDAICFLKTLLEKENSI